MPLRTAKERLQAKIKAKKDEEEKAKAKIAADDEARKQEEKKAIFESEAEYYAEERDALAEIGKAISKDSRHQLVLHFLELLGLKNEARPHVLMAATAAHLNAIPRSQADFLPEKECFIGFGKANIWLSLFEFCENLNETEKSEDLKPLSDQFLKLFYAECCQPFCSLYHLYQTNKFQQLSSYHTFAILMTKLDRLRVDLNPLPEFGEEADRLSRIIHERDDKTLDELKKANAVLLSKFPQLVFSAMSMAYKQNLKEEGEIFAQTADKFLQQRKRDLPDHALDFEGLRVQMHYVHNQHKRLVLPELKLNLLNHLYALHQHNWPNRHRPFVETGKPVRYSMIPLIMGTLVDLERYLKEILPHQQHPLVKGAVPLQTAIALANIQALQETLMLLIDYTRTSRKKITARHRSAVYALLTQVVTLTEESCKLEKHDKRDDSILEAFRIIREELNTEMKEHSALLNSASTSSSSSSSSSSTSSTTLPPAEVEDLGNLLASLSLAEEPASEAEQVAQAALVKLRDSAAQEMTAFKASLAAEREEKRAQKQQEIDKRFETEKARILMDLGKEKIKITNEQEPLLKAQESELERNFTARCENEMAAYNIAIAEFEESLKNRIRDTQAEHDRRLIEIRRDHAESLRVVQTYNHEAKSQRSKILREERVVFRKTVEEETKTKIRTENTRHQEEMKTLKSEHVTQKEAIVREYEKKLADLKQQHKDELANETALFEQSLVKRRIPVPEVAATLMKELKAAGIECYMSGRTVGRALLGLAPSPDEGIEITVNAASLPALLQGRFAQHATLPDYYDSMGNDKLFLYCKTWAKLPRKLGIATILREKDSTLEKLFCDEEGRVFDTLQDFIDLQNTRLKPEGNLAQRLNTDPFLAFRLIHLQTTFGKTLQADKLQVIRQATTYAFHLPSDIWRECLEAFFLNSQAGQNLKVVLEHGLLSHLLPPISAPNPLEPLHINQILAYWDQEIPKLQRDGFLPKLIGLFLLAPLMNRLNLPKGVNKVEVADAAPIVKQCVQDFCDAYPGKMKPEDRSYIEKATPVMLKAILVDFLSFCAPKPVQATFTQVQAQPALVTPMYQTMQATQLRSMAATSATSAAFVPLKLRQPLKGF